MGSSGNNLTINGAITGPGALTQYVTASGKLTLANPTNTYSGGTVVYKTEMTVAANASLGIGDVTVANSGTLSLWGNGNIGGGDMTTANDDRAARLTVFSAGKVNFYCPAPSIGSLSGGGTLVLSNTVLTVGGDNSSTIWNGAINQFAGTTGSVVKVGSGTLTMDGWTRHIGSTTVSNGTLVANTSLPGPVTVASGATLLSSGAFAGPLTNSGVLSAGMTNTVGTLTAGGLTMLSGATFVVNVAGTNSFDQVSVNGPVALGAGVCSLQVVLGYAPQAGDSFAIVLNDGADAVTGAFAGLIEGARVDCGAFNGKPYRCTISYAANGGDGGANDVVLSNFRSANAGTVLLVQ
ncbi:MAG: autotransporter-associated beta strand repeat-containing protein [bacterium]